MNLYGVIFYILAAIILATTALAVTRRNLMHAIVYLVLSFFGTALLFYLLGAPFLAVLEVIIYAGAIMVLFLFIVMMLEIKPPEKPRGAYLRQWLPAAVLGALCLAVAFVLIVFKSGEQPAPAAGRGLAPGIRPVFVPEILVFGGDRLLSAVCGPGGGPVPGPAGGIGTCTDQGDTRGPPHGEELMDTIVPYSHVLVLAGSPLSPGGGLRRGPAQSGHDPHRRGGDAERRRPGPGGRARCAGSSWTARPW